MSRRHDKVGIKQGLRKEWLDKALDLRLAGLSNSEVRDELIDYMSSRLDSGARGERGETTTKIAVSMLMNIWGNVSSDIEPLQEKALSLVDVNRTCCHWAMISAAYPFWYQVSQQTGRLLFLQEHTTKTQIIQKVRENYGDRSSVIRSAQRVVQGFIGLDVLNNVDDCNQLGHVQPIILDSRCAVLLFESALYAEREGKLALASMRSNPAFFPFQIPIITSDIVQSESELIDVNLFAFNDELLKLKGL